MEHVMSFEDLGRITDAIVADIEASPAVGAYFLAKSNRDSGKYFDTKFRDDTLQEMRSLVRRHLDAYRIEQREMSHGEKESNECGGAAGGTPSGV
jgi:hypothetical protein